MCQNANFMRKISISILNVSNGTQNMPWSATHCCGGGSFSSNSGQLNQFILSSTCSFFPHIPIQLVEPSESPESTEISKSFWNLQCYKKLVKRIQSTKVVSNKFINFFFQKRENSLDACWMVNIDWLYEQRNNRSNPTQVLFSITFSTSCFWNDGFKCLHIWTWFVNSNCVRIYVLIWRLWNVNRNRCEKYFQSAQPINQMTIHTAYRRLLCLSQINVVIRLPSEKLTGDANFFWRKNHQFIAIAHICNFDLLWCQSMNCFDISSVNRNRLRLRLRFLIGTNRGQSIQPLVNCCVIRDSCIVIIFLVSCVCSCSTHSI